MDLSLCRPASRLLAWSLTAAGLLTLPLGCASDQSSRRSSEPVATGDTSMQTPPAGDRVEALIREVDERYVSAADVAMLQGHLGRIEQAFEWLHRAVEQRAPWLGFLQVDPIWKPLRSDKRFAAIAESVGAA